MHSVNNNQAPSSSIQSTQHPSKEHAGMSLTRKVLVVAFLAFSAIAATLAFLNHPYAHALRASLGGGPLVLYGVAAASAFIALCILCIRPKVVSPAIPKAPPAPPVQQQSQAEQQQAARPAASSSDDLDRHIQEEKTQTKQQQQETQQRQHQSAESDDGSMCVVQ